MKKFRERLALFIAPSLKPQPTPTFWFAQNSYTTTTAPVKVTYR